MLKYILLAAM